MKFQAGEAWSGNRNGRPKGPDVRSKFTKKIVESHSETLEQILHDLGEQAKTQDRWAVEKYIHYLSPYLLVKPKSEVDISSNTLSVGQDAYANLSKEAQALIVPHMEAIKKIMSQQ